MSHVMPLSVHLYLICKILVYIIRTLTWLSDNVQYKYWYNNVHGHPYLVLHGLDNNAISLVHRTWAREVHNSAERLFDGGTILDSLTADLQLTALLRPTKLRWQAWLLRRGVNSRDVIQIADNIRSVVTKQERSHALVPLLGGGFALSRWCCGPDTVCSSLYDEYHSTFPAMRGDRITFSLVCYRIHESFKNSNNMC